MLKIQHLAPVVAVSMLALLAAQSTIAQESDKLVFETASVKANKTGDRAANSNVPLGPGSVFTPTGGYLSVVNYPLFSLIAFAYKLTGYQEELLRSRVPGWVLSDRFDVQARAAGNPTKDELRLMMRSLLAERFNLVIHQETRQIPVFALVVSKPGATGPQLRRHAGEGCTDSLDADPKTSILDSGFPRTCGGLLPLPHGPGRLAKFGARKVSMTFIANQLSIMSQLGRPVLDKSGLSGMFDFSLEWVPERTGPQSPDADAEAPPSGPTFMQALSDQLGLKLVAQTGPAEVLLLDRVEHLTEN